MNCKESTYLIEKNKEGKLSLKESIMLKIHLATCKFCKLFEKQTDFIESNLNPKKDTQLPEEFKQDLINKLNSKK